MQDLFQVHGWLREHFPQHPHIYFGVSGTTLLHEALKTEGRTLVIMPAFICPGLSEMAARAGKQVIHIDSDPQTLHPDLAQLETQLACQDASETIVLIDHTFGYPFPGLAGLRRKFPQLLIIEDCARGLGTRINGHFPGRHADWILLSMYKTILGSTKGAVLLTRTPVPLTDGRSTRATLRERAATIRPVRFIHDLWKRRHPDFGARPSGLISPEWAPEYGFPSDLSMSRFADELRDFDMRASVRRSIAGELIDRLSLIPNIQCIASATKCHSANHFVSFTVRPDKMRDRILTALHGKGFFLYRTWNVVPAHYRRFSGTFPSEHRGSEYLADHIVHVSVNLFVDCKQHRQLIPALSDVVLQCCKG